MHIAQRIGIALAMVALGLLSWAHTVHSASQARQRDKPDPARQEQQDIETRLRELEQMSEQGQYDDLLREIEKEAQKQVLPRLSLDHLRARVLHRLRPQEPAQREELIQLWEAVRQSYRERGYAPGEVEATLALAFCYWQTDRARAEQLLNEGEQRASQLHRAARASADSVKPLELAQALGFCAGDWFEIEEWAVCQRLWERALALQEAHGEKELTLARTRYNLGVLALKQNLLETAQIHLQEALAAQERLAPDSPALASTLLAAGELAQRRDQPADALNRYQRALEIHTAKQLNTLETARIHLGLADLARQQRLWNEAQSQYERARQVAEQIDPQARETGQAYAGLGVVALEQGALDTAEQQLQRAQQNPNLEPLEKAQIDHELGRVAWRRGRLEDASKNLTRALEQQQSLTDTPLNIAKTLYNLGALMLERGEIDQARDHFTQAREIREREAPRSLLVAHVLMGLGFVAFYEQNYSQARRLFEEAHDLYKSLNAEPADRSRALMALGLVAIEQGELNQAHQLLEDALRLQEGHRLTNTALHAQTRIGLGNLHLRQGHWNAASRHYHRAKEIAAQSPGRLWLHAQALIGLGNLALRQRDLRQAEAHYENSWTILRENFPNSPLTVQALFNYGIVALESGDTDAAQARLSEAEKRIAQQSNSELAARVRLNKTILEIRSGATADASRTLDQLIALLQSSGTSRLLLGQAYFYRGVLRALQEDESAARDDFNRALELYQQVAPNTIFVALTHLNLAKLDYRVGDAPSARKRLEQAITLIERQRNMIRDPDLQAAFGENYFEAYSLLALLEAERGNAARAAELLEQSRARTLLEQIQRTQLERLNASIEWQETLRELRDLEAERINIRSRIANFYALAAQGEMLPEDASRESFPLLEKLGVMDQTQQQLEAKLRDRFPHEARLLAPPQMSLASIQQHLEPDVALVYHALVESNLLIVVVTQQGAQAHHQPVSVSTLSKDIDEFRERDRLEKETEEMKDIGARLYGTLIAPVAQFLRGYPRVLLCPEGNLNQIPWAALVVEVKDGKPVYWVERVALHLTPSMGVYRYARLFEPAPRGALVAAVSKYETTEVQSESPASLSERVEVAKEPDTRGAVLTDLPAAAKEADKLENILRGALVLREDAVQPEFVRQQARSVRLLHFACHAEADSENPLNSALKFAVQQDRWLTAAQIMAQWRLQADLVMLSACETASGKVYRYEGVFGLARVFLHAGAKSVGATLWQVEDESTAELVEEFYRGYILQKLPKDRALQQAQLQMLGKGKSPYYWGGFVLIGDSR